MGTKRQATIKTLLLLTAVVAVQCATTSGSFRSPVLMSGDLRAGIWYSTVTGIFFWAILPLTISLFVRSMLRVLAAGLVIGCLALCAYLFWMRYAIEMADSFVGYRLTGFIYGPFGCFEPILQAWRRRSTEPMPKVLGFSIYGNWLVLYTMVYLLFAKSCLLRKKSKQPESPEHYASKPMV